MRKGNSKIGRCLEFFALQKIGMTFKLLSYSGLSRVSRIFKWILGTSPSMIISTSGKCTLMAMCILVMMVNAAMVQLLVSSL